MSEVVKLYGTWRATLHNDTEGVKKVVEGPNVITTVGKDLLASFLVSAAGGSATFTCRYAAIGTDSTAEAVGNTALGTEVARVSGSVAHPSAALVTVTATFPSGTGTGAIVEYGLFSSSTGGVLLSRDVESVINKGANDVLTTVFNLTIS